MKKVLLILPILFLFNKVFGQCNTNSNVENGDTYIQTSLENIYKNKDLENGIKAFSIGSIFKIPKTGDPTSSIKLAGAYGGSYSIPIARSIKVVSKDNLQIILVGADFKEVNLGSAKGYVMFFDLTLKETYFLLNKEIDYIDITDTRTNESIKVYPYSKVLSEQLNCVINK
jgi:hypothetical protein